jgi:hypothetical protein
MSDTVTLLPREIRMIVERILLLTPLPMGLVPAVRDAVLYAAGAGLGGLPLLQARFETLLAADPSALRIEETSPGCLAIDAGGQHAWVVLPFLLDALGEAAARTGRATASLAGVLDPQELGAAVALGPRAGLAIAVTPPGQLVAAPAAGAPDAMLARLLREGVPTARALWQALHALSNRSLSADTPESRRHAGPVIVEADGRVIGRTDLDDETDLSLLTRKTETV